MKLIYTPEAKAFVNHNFSVEGNRKPLLPVFLAKGSGLVFSAKSAEAQRTFASQMMSKVTHRHYAILKLLRPFFFLDDFNLFRDMEGIEPFDSSMILSDLLLPACDLLYDFDALMGMKKVYPEIGLEYPELYKLGSQALIGAFSSVNKAARTINSGRADAKHE